MHALPVGLILVRLSSTVSLIPASNKARMIAALPLYCSVDTSTASFVGSNVTVNACIASDVDTGEA